MFGNKITEGQARTIAKKAAQHEVWDANIEHRATQTAILNRLKMIDKRIHEIEARFFEGFVPSPMVEEPVDAQWARLKKSVRGLVPQPFPVEIEETIQLYPSIANPGQTRIVLLWKAEGQSYGTDAIGNMSAGMYGYVHQLRQHNIKVMKARGITNYRVKYAY